MLWKKHAKNSIIHVDPPVHVDISKTPNLGDF